VTWKELRLKVFVKGVVNPGVGLTTRIAFVKIPGKRALGKFKQLTKFKQYNLY